jgi:single-strand DNA-binding protein
MADGLNRCEFIGNLGSDPELRVTPGGQAVLKLRMACTESYKDNQSNERKERTEWVRCTIFGKRGEALSKILHKGDRVFVEGRLQTSSYEKNNEKRYSTEIVVTNVILCGGGKSHGASSSSGGPRFDEPEGAGTGSDDFPFGANAPPEPPFG